LRRRTLTVALIPISASFLAGCGTTASSDPPSSSAGSTALPGVRATPGHAAPATPAQEASTASAPESQTSGPPSFVVNATTQQGDTVKIEGWFGPALPASESDVDQTAFNECPAPAPDGRAIVVRLDLSATLESSLSGEVELNTGSAIGGVDYVMGYSSGAQCESGAESTGAKLGTLQPHQATDFTMWVVFVNAITPNNPHPSEKALGEHALGNGWVMAIPGVTVDDSASAGEGHQSASGPRVVACEPGGPIPERSEYLAPIGGTPKLTRGSLCPTTLPS
jgi:hypothetical protein